MTVANVVAAIVALVKFEHMPVNRELLTRKFTVEDENDFIPTNEDPDPILIERAITEPELNLPFGFGNDRWEAIKTKMQPGDELWEFCTPDWTWQEMVGRKGIVLLRGAEEIAWIITLMN